MDGIERMSEWMDMQVNRGLCKQLSKLLDHIPPFCLLQLDLSTCRGYVRDYLPSWP